MRERKIELTFMGILKCKTKCGKDWNQCEQIAACVERNLGKSQDGTSLLHLLNKRRYETSAM